MLQNDRHPEGLAARRRLHDDDEVAGLLRAGRKIVLGHWRVYVRDNGLAFLRLAIRTPKQAGLAHDRNRMRRVAREFFRRHQDVLVGKDWLLVARWQEKKKSVVTNDAMRQEWQNFLQDWHRGRRCA